MVRESGRRSGLSVRLVHERQDQAAEFVMESCRRRDNTQLMMLADLLVFVSPWNTCHVWSRRFSSYHVDAGADSIQWLAGCRPGFGAAAPYLPAQRRFLARLFCP